jgi:hypothetical protein
MKEMRIGAHTRAQGPHSGSLPLDIREALINATVEALLLDLQEVPAATVNSPWGTDRPIDGEQKAVAS